MAHYIGKYNDETELKIALTNGSLLEPYVAAVGTGSSVYYSSDPSPVQPYVCEYSADTATTISAAGGSYSIELTSDTPRTFIFINGTQAYYADSDQTSTGITASIQIPENTAETQNRYDVVIKYTLADVDYTLVKSDSFVLTQAAAVYATLCSATFTTTEPNQTVKVLNGSTQVTRVVKRLKIDGVPYTITGGTVTEKSNYTFENPGVHTVVYPSTAESAISITIGLFSQVPCETITLDPSILEITANAFANEASALTDFYGENITTITGLKFSSIENLHTPKLKYASASAFQGCKNLNPDFISGLTSVGNNAFCGCTFTTVVVNSGLTSLGYSAFQMNTALTSCQINGVSGYTSSNFSDSGMFNGCTSLTGFTYPDEWVQSNASTTYPTFKDCSAMTEVTFGTGMTSIGSGMFSVGNSSLVTIKSYAATAPTLGGNDFDSITGNTGTLYVPAGSDYSTWSAALGENWTVSDTL